MILQLFVLIEVSNGSSHAFYSLGDALLVLFELLLHVLEPVEPLERLDLVQNLEQISHTQGEAVLGDEGILVVFLGNFGLALLHVLDIVQGQGWEHDVEEFKVLALGTVEDALEVLDEDAQEVGRVLGLLEEEADRHVEHLGGFHGLALDAEVFSYFLEFYLFQELWDEFDEI